MTKVRHPRMTKVRHLRMTKVRHLRMTKVRHLRMTKVRHLRMAHPSGPPFSFFLFLASPAILTIGVMDMLKEGKGALKDTNNMKAHEGHEQHEGQTLVLQHVLRHLLPPSAHPSDAWNLLHRNLL